MNISNPKWFLALLCIYVAPLHAFIRDDGSCPLITFITAEAEASSPRWPAELRKFTAFSYMAAVQMAIDDFNARDPSVVPELADLDCKLMLPSNKFVDDRDNAKYGVLEFVSSGRDVSKRPCSVIGPRERTNFQRLAPITFSYGIPHMSYDEAEQNFARNTGHALMLPASVDSRARALASYIRRPGFERDYFLLAGVTNFVLDVFSEALKGYLEEAGATAVVDTRSEANDATFVRNIGINTIYVELDEPEDLEDIAEEFDEIGMLDGDFFFILPDAAIPIDGVSAVMGSRTPGSAVDKLLNGALVIGHGYFTIQDAFLDSWRKKNSTFVEHLKDVAPTNVTFDNVASDFFQTEYPAAHVVYGFDSVMALGFGLCDALATASPNTTYEELDQVGAIRDTNFTGASGGISFNGQRMRNFEGLSFEAYNIRPTEVDPSTGTRTYQAVLTSAYSPETGWVEVESFIYSDGSTTGPPPNERKVFDSNYLPKAVRKFGLTLFGFTLFLNAVCIALVLFMQKDRLVRAAQPFFLILVCVGSMILSTTIYTVSWDESYGKSQQQLDVLCTLSPWFFVLGYLLMFLSLFTKLWRLEKIMQLRRAQTIMIRHVILPMVALLTIAIIFLTLWTVTAPLVWRRDMLTEEPPTTSGECTSDSFELYGSLLGVLLLCGGVSTAGLAWRTSDIAQDFSDTNSVFAAIFLQIQAWLMGVPILIAVGNDNSGVSYFALVLITWIFAMSGVALVVIPKVLLALAERLKLDETVQRRSRMIHVSGIQTGTGTRTERSVQRLEQSFSLPLDAGADDLPADDGSRQLSVHFRIPNEGDNDDGAPATEFTEDTTVFDRESTAGRMSTLTSSEIDSGPLTVVEDNEQQGDQRRASAASAGEVPSSFFLDEKDRDDAHTMGDSENQGDQRPANQGEEPSSLFLDEKDKDGQNPGDIESKVEEQESTVEVTEKNGTEQKEDWWDK